MRLNFPALILIFSALLVFCAAEGRAQECGIVPSSIATLSPPGETMPAIWSMDGGDRNLTDRFIAGMVDPADRNLIVLGERYFKEGENVGLTLRKLDGRGRTVWDTILNNKNLEKIIKLVPLEKGMMVLAGRGGGKAKSSVWIGFFDTNGALTGESEIKAPAGGLAPFDILPLNNARSFLLAAQVKDGSGVPYTALYRLDRKAKVLGSKAYQMGLENGLTALGLGKGGVVYGAGYIMDGKGRRNAWVVKFNEEGGFFWQRQLARGRKAELGQIALYGEGNLVVAGVSEPYDLKTPLTRNKGAWVAMLEEGAGGLVWERFYSEPDHDLLTRNFIIGKDGQITLLMDAAAHEKSPEGAQSFVRLTGFNKRGVMLESAVYLNGEGADAYAFLPGAGGERIILGTTRVLYTAMTRDPENAKTEPRPKKAVARQGWAIAVPGAIPYQDPCEE